MPPNVDVRPPWTESESCFVVIRGVRGLTSPRAARVPYQVFDSCLITGLIDLAGYAKITSVQHAWLNLH